MNQINIQFNPNENKYITLYKHIKNLIIEGKIKSNEKLPSRRFLSNYLNVSTNTILNAYNLLLEEGYIYSKDKSGYFISPFRSYKNSVNTSIIEASEKNYLYDFTMSKIDESIFPFYTIKKVVQDILNNDSKVWLTKSSYQGDKNLRETIAKYLYENKGMNVNLDNIVIVSSLEESLEIISNIITINKIGIENPTYKKVYSFFKKNNKFIHLFPLDDEGISLKKKVQLDLIYVTPYNQFPLGIKMSNSRRKELLEYPSTYIFEDDFNCDLIMQNKVMSTLYSLNNDKVIYHGSFSQTLCPGLRISYLVLPSSLISRYKEKYQNSSIRISSLDQTLLTHLIKDGYYYRHITSLKKAMSKKKEIIKEIFISRNIKYQETELSFIIDIDKDIEIIKKHLDDAFINVKFVSDYYIDNKDDRLIISYNSIPLSKIKDAISKLLDLAFSN